MQDYTQYLYQLKLANKLEYVKNINVNAEQFYKQTRQCIYERVANA